MKNGSFESWASPSVPDSWTVLDPLGGTFTKDTTIFSHGAASLGLVKSASSALSLTQNLSFPLVPGMYYLISLDRYMESATAQAPQAASRLVNLTRGTSLGSGGTWITSAFSNWTGAQKGLLRWQAIRLWFQVPDAYALTDAWSLRVGNFGTTTGYTNRFDDVRLVGPFSRAVHKIAPALWTVHHTDPAKQFNVYLVTPTGVTLDITARLTKGGLGTITEAAEEDFLILTHSDQTLALDDRDGYIRGLLDGAATTDRWELVVERETGKRQPKWERAFAGVLDLPWSVGYDPETREAKMQVFSYSKTLERTTAETVRRNITGVTGSVTVGSATVTLTSTTGLQSGDVVQLTKAADGATESQTVKSVDSATVVTCTATWGNTFASGSPMELLTPYHRNRDPLLTVADLFTAAGVMSQNVSISPVTGAPAIPVPMNGNGGRGLIRSLVPVTAANLLNLRLTTDVTRFKAPECRTGFIVDTATTTAQGDWTPYTPTEPATILTTTGAGGSPTVDRGGIGWKYPYTAALWWWPTGYTDVSNSYCDVLRQDGTLLAQVDTIGNTNGYSIVAGEWVPSDSGVWVYFHRGGNSTVGKLRRVDSGTGAVSDVSLLNTGIPRYSVQTDRVYTWDTNGDGKFSDPGTGILREWLPTGARNLTRSIDLSGYIGRGQGYLWAARIVDTGGAKYMLLPYISPRPYSTLARGWLLVLDLNNLTVVQNIKVGSRQVDHVQGTVYQDSLRGCQVYAANYSRESGSGLTGVAVSDWVAAAPCYAGVIPYADLSGKSVAGGLKELAVCCGAFMDVDVYNTGRFLPRGALERQAPVAILSGLVNRKDRQIWEFYRTSVEVSGRDEAGTDFTVVAGDQAKGALRTSVSSNLVTTPTMAAAVAGIYAAYLSQARAQADVTQPELDELLKAWDVVELDDGNWFITQVRTNLEAETQDLRLFQVKG